MSVSPHTPADSPGFSPSLSLKEIRTAVGALSNTQLDVLAYIGDGDDELCKVAHTDRLHLETYLANIYRRLGINLALSIEDKRRAAGLMNKAYDQEGWRPGPEDTAFLLFARGSTAPAPNGAGRGVAESAIVIAMPALPSANEAEEEGPVLPTVAELIDRIPQLTGWKLRFLGWETEGLSREQMLDEVRKDDPGADMSTVSSTLHKLHKALGIPSADVDEAALALVIQASREYRTQAAAHPPQPKRDEAETAHDRADDHTASDTSADLEPIVARIERAVKDGEVSDRAMQILDRLLIEKAETIAPDFQISTSNVDQYVKRFREKFEVPAGSSESAKKRGAQERKVLLDAWRLYRSRPATADDAKESEEESVLEAPTPSSPAPPPPALVDAPEPVPEAPPPPAELAPEPVLEAPAPVYAPQAAAELEPAPRDEEEPQPAPSLAPSVSDGSLRDPQSIRAVKSIWSLSPTFEEDQARALEEGYLIERMEHVVSFHPVFQAASVVVLVKRT